MVIIDNNIVARAAADLQRARLSAERARETLMRAEMEVSDLEAFLRMLERYSTAKADLPTRERASNTVRTGPGPGTRAYEMVNVAIEAIKEAGKPLLIGELLDRVLAAGFQLGGADQKSNLAGYLSRDPRVHSVGRSIGWNLVEHEEAAQEPGSDQAASSSATGGTDDRPTLAFPDAEAAALLED